MSKEWKHTDKRFVAFLDIMGFKEMVARNDHEAIRKNLESLTQLRKLLEAIMGMTFLAQEEKMLRAKKVASIRSIAFSDTILFVSLGDNQGDFHDIVNCSNSFRTAAFNAGIPVKGAIAHGLLTADFDNQIFFGQPLIDAYLLQEELKYYGIVVHNSIEQKVEKKSIDSDTISKIKWLPTPMKAGLIHHYNVDFSEIKLGDLTKLYHTVSGAPRVYVDNTIKQFEAFSK